jgi:hypothetical protein
VAGLAGECGQVLDCFDDAGEASGSGESGRGDGLLADGRRGWPGVGHVLAGLDGGGELAGLLPY